jgi:predicted nucleotidyltransferase
MEQPLFRHYVSKGSRYNQIYLPKEMNQYFNVGDMVEVRLVEKGNRVYQSEMVGEISEFKKKLIKEIFKIISNRKEVEQIFIFGSFLTKKEGYNDIDILILTKEKDEGIEEEIYKQLTEEFNLKFHVISIEKSKLEDILEVDPMTRSMFSRYVSDKEFKMSKKTKRDRNHLLFLMMMPEDILKFKMNREVYYDNLRKLITIERFLDKKEIDSVEIRADAERILDKIGFNDFKGQSFVNEKELKELKKLFEPILKGAYKKINE